MAHTFRIQDSMTTPLWDYGWFDLTRFDVECAGGDRQDSRSILRAFLRDPISQRSFCTLPDPWGNSGELHGPFPVETLSADWYRAVSLEDLQRRVAAILDDPGFSSSPSTEQRRPVTEWLGATRVRGDDVVVLDAPAHPGVRVDWDVFILFHEFVCFSPDREEMIVAAIGCD